MTLIDYINTLHWPAPIGDWFTVSACPWNPQGATRCYIMIKIESADGGLPWREVIGDVADPGPIDRKAARDAVWRLASECARHRMLADLRSR